MKSKLLTVNEAAEAQGLSPKAIYAAMATKRLPRRYHRGNLVVRESDLAVWESLKRKSGRPQGRTLSLEHKTRIAEAQKRRWQQRQ